MSCVESLFKSNNQFILKNQQACSLFFMGSRVYPSPKADSRSPPGAHTLSLFLRPSHPHPRHPIPFCTSPQQHYVFFACIPTEILSSVARSRPSCRQQRWRSPASNTGTNCCRSERGGNGQALHACVQCRQGQRPEAWEVIHLFPGLARGKPVLSVGGSVKVHIMLAFQPSLYSSSRLSTKF